MDGWEAARILRRERQADVPILIVSANAYEKGQLEHGGADNPAGIAAADFIVKPVNVGELLERIGLRLGLEWIMRDATAPAPAAEPSPLRFPPPDRIDALRAQVALGYVRGITRQLDDIAALDPQYAAFVATLRQHAARFDLDAIAAFLAQEQP